MGRKKVKSGDCLIDNSNDEANQLAINNISFTFNESTVYLVIKLILLYFIVSSINLSTISSLLMDSMGLLFGRGSCSISIPSTWVNLLHPKIANCSQCSTINRIIEVPNITREQFEARFAYSMEPLVIRGIINDWKASQAFSLDFFRKVYSSSNQLYRCQFFPYKTPYKTLHQALNSIPYDYHDQSNKAWYIGWSNCEPEITRLMRKYYERPSFLPNDSEDSRLDWIFMGTPGYGAPMHIDNVGYPSWQAQITGNKKWTLEPPIECYFQCKRFEIEINAGDIIVLDTNKWFHKTKIIGNEMSITIGSEYD